MVKKDKKYKNDFVALMFLHTFHTCLSRKQLLEVVSIWTLTHIIFLKIAHFISKTHETHRLKAVKRKMIHCSVNISKCLKIINF